MEYRAIIIKIFIVNFILQGLLLGCVDLRNDSIEYKKKIYEQFVIIKQENSSHFQLAYQTDINSYDIIVESCNEVYIDSMNKLILVNEKFGVSNFFFVIKIKSDKANSSIEAMSKTEIDLSKYDNFIQNLERVFLIDSTFGK